MAEISQERLAEVERCKSVIGWSWQEVSNRMGWGPPGLMKFRSLKAPIPEEAVEYLRAVAEAVQAIPLPSIIQPETAAPAPSNAIDDKMRAAGLRPAPEPTNTEIRVMTLETIAEKLAAEYRQLRSDPELSMVERNAALATVGRLAERLGVVAEVRQLIQPSAAHAQQQAAEAEVAWTPPRPRSLDRMSMTDRDELAVPIR